MRKRGFMAINKVMHAALKAISYVDLDIHKTYKLSRNFQTMISKLYTPPKDYEIWDHRVLNGGYQVPVRIFTGKNAEPSKTLLFFHGGGWITGDINTYNRICVDMCAETGCRVISVDYRLAPERRFPTAIEDCYAVLRELMREKSRGAFHGEIILIGDSAGGNIAAAVSLMARDRGEFLPTKQILIYPATSNDHSEDALFPSITQNGTDYLLTAKRVSDYLELYRSCDEDLNNPYFAPLLEKDLRNQPDTLVITADLCPLRDEGEYYGQLLRSAGNRVTIHRVIDALHGFFTLPPFFKHVAEAYEVMNAFLGQEGSIEK